VNILFEKPPLPSRQKAHSENNIQYFAGESINLDKTNPQSETFPEKETLSLQKTVFPADNLESYLYSATKHSAACVKSQTGFLANDSGLKIKDISRVDDRLGTEGKA